MQLPPGQQPPGYPYYPAPQVVYNMGTHGLAMASGIIGILSWFLCPFIGAIAAIITGHVAMGELKNSPRAGRGWATAGLILGYAHLVIYSLVLVFLFAVCGAVGIATQ